MLYLNDQALGHDHGGGDRERVSDRDLLTYIAKLTI